MIAPSTVLAHSYYFHLKQIDRFMIVLSVPYHDFTSSWTQTSTYKIWVWLALLCYISMERLPAKLETNAAWSRLSQHPNSSIRSAEHRTTRIILSIVLTIHSMLWRYSLRHLQLLPSMMSKLQPAYHV